MKFSKLIIPSFILLFIHFSSFAQTATEMEMAKSMARSYGYSESEINAMINKNKSGSAQTAAVVPEVSRTVTTEEVAAGLDINQTGGTAISATSTGIYGHDLFKSPDLNFVPSYNIPTPENYRLAAGDEIVIELWGAVYMNFTQKISPEGSISIQDLGPIYLTGLTINQAQNTLKSSLSRIYSGISGSEPNTFLRLSLGRIRSFSINVVGDAERPGTFTLPSLSTVFSALYMAGGPKKMGSVRDIRIYRDNKLFKKFDIYDFVVKGDFSANIRLEDNDLIMVSPFINHVSITGKVKRPMTYEMKDGETLENLLFFAAGYAKDANETYAHLIRVKGDRTESFDVSYKDFKTFKLLDGDQVTIPTNITDNKNLVNISGYIWHPGSYAISDTLNTMRQLIKAAGGLREGAYLERAYIERFNERRDTIALNFNVGKVMSGEEEVKLSKDDKITIFAYPQIEKRTLVYSFGEFNRPDTFVYRPGMTLGDVILLSKGFTVGAAKSNIDIARRNVNDGAMQATDTISTVFNFNLLNNPEAIEFLLAPYDVIFVRTAPNYKKQQIIKVEGEVNFPGSYVLETNVVRLSDVIKKAGGFNKDAYIRGATIQRRLTDEEYERAVMAREMALRQPGIDSTSIEMVYREVRYNVGIDLKAAMDSPASYADIVLRSGDIVSVPKLNNTVKISGGVLFKNVVAYDPNLSLKEYVNMAGGYMKNARRKDIYIVYMNGTISKRGTSRFKVEPGCEIIVPIKEIDSDKKITTAEVMSIASSSASVATMVVSMVSLLKK